MTERCMWSDFTEADVRRKSDCLILYTTPTILPWALQHTGHQHSLILWLYMLDAPGWPKLQFTSFLCLAGRAISTQPSSGTVLSLWETNAVLTMNCFKVCTITRWLCRLCKTLIFAFHISLPWPLVQSHQNTWLVPFAWLTLQINLLTHEFEFICINKCKLQATSSPTVHPHLCQY